MTSGRNFVCALMFGFIAGVAGIAEAGFRRHPAVNCFSYYPDNVADLWTGIAGQLSNHSTSDPMLVVCPLNDESDFRNESLDGVAGQDRGRSSSDYAAIATGSTSLVYRRAKYFQKPSNRWLS